jgi:hypothetical protein
MCSDDTVRIPLRAKDGSVRAYALVDAADAEFVGRWTWRLDAQGYAGRGERVGGRTGPYTHIFLHRELLGLPRGDQAIITDHINRDRLDNRRANLRALLKASNPQNVPSYRGASSQYRGVSWMKRNRKWIAYVQIEGKQHYLGLFVSEDEAASAAKAARVRLLPYATD